MYKELLCATPMCYYGIIWRLLPTSRKSSDNVAPRIALLLKTCPKRRLKRMGRKPRTTGYTSPNVREAIDTKTIQNHDWESYAASGNPINHQRKRSSSASHYSISRIKLLLFREAFKIKLYHHGEKKFQVFSTKSLETTSDPPIGGGHSTTIFLFDGLSPSFTASWNIGALSQQRGGSKQ